MSTSIAPVVSFPQMTLSINVRIDKIITYGGDRKNAFTIRIKRLIIRERFDCGGKFSIALTLFLVWCLNRIVSCRLVRSFADYLMMVWTSHSIVDECNFLQTLSVLISKYTFLKYWLEICFPSFHLFSLCFMIYKTSFSFNQHRIRTSYSIFSLCSVIDMISLVFLLLTMIVGSEPTSSLFVIITS